jgi:hypothetical protein
MLDKYNEFLIEKKIAQISANVEVRIGFDIIKTKHADNQSDFSKRGLDGDNQNYISNSEIKEFVLFFIKEISSAIAHGEINNQDNFVIKSVDRELAIAIVANEISKTYWQLIVKTIFRESEYNSFRVGEYQLVLNK